MAERARGDLLSSMLAVEDEAGRRTPEEVIDAAIAILFAGFETSMGTITSGLVARSSTQTSWHACGRRPS